MRHGRLITAAIAACATMAIAPAWAAAAPASFVDDSAGQFGAGTLDATTAVLPAGSVALNGTFAVEPFDGGPGLPTGLSDAPWSPTGTAVVGGGTLTVNNDLVTADQANGPGQSLEFDAAFSGAPGEHVGFADSLD